MLFECSKPVTTRDFRSFLMISARDWNRPLDAMGTGMLTGALGTACVYGQEAV